MKIEMDDKVLHILGGFLTYALAAVIDKGDHIPAVSVVLIAVLKEGYDYWSYGRFDVMDIAYTIAGGIIFLFLELWFG